MIKKKLSFAKNKGDLFDMVKLINLKIFLFKKRPVT